MTPPLRKLQAKRRERQNPGRTMPKSSHTTAEWDAIKPHFQHLYITEEKRLKEVQRILEQEYNFSATTKMLKTRITIWGIGKHRNIRQVRHALKIFRRAERAGRKVSMTIKGIPTTLDDILKHLHKKGIDEDSVQSPTSSTPTSIEYCEYEEDEKEEGKQEEEEGLDSSDEEEDSEADDDEEFDHLSSTIQNTPLYDDSHEDIDASSGLNVQYSPTSMYDDTNEQLDPDASTENFAKTFHRQMTLSDESMSGESPEILDEVKVRILESVREFLSKTLPYTRPQSSYFTSACPGRAALKAFDEAIRRNDKEKALLEYQKGLGIMEQMMKVPNPFCIVYVCELMRIALMNKAAAMPEKMLEYVTELATSPLTTIVSSVMQANDDNGLVRIRLLEFVYQNAMEVIKRDAPENVVFEVLKNRFAIFCSEMD